MRAVCCGRGAIDVARPRFSMCLSKCVVEEKMKRSWKIVVR